MTEDKLRELTRLGEVGQVQTFWILVIKNLLLFWMRREVLIGF